LAVGEPDAGHPPRAVASGATYVKLNDEMIYLWRAVEQKGEVLESYVSGSRTRRPRSPL
jgi:transposase-like protein